MIYGIGNDILEISRIAGLVQDERFVERVFTAEEQIHATMTARADEIYAADFSAKEAVLKAFRIGLDGFSLVDIEVLRNENGAPYIELHGTLKDFAERLKVKEIHLSLSHDKGLVSAFCVIEV